MLFLFTSVYSLYIQTAACLYRFLLFHEWLQLIKCFLFVGLPLRTDISQGKKQTNKKPQNKKHRLSQHLIFYLSIPQIVGVLVPEDTAVEKWLSSDPLRGCTVLSPRRPNTDDTQRMGNTYTIGTSATRPVFLMCAYNILLTENHWH